MGNHLDALEPRRLFASTPAVILDGSVLRIGGTGTSDDIAIAAGRVQFEAHVNGQVHPFNTADVRLIRVSGGRGHDSIIVSPNLRIRCNIEGGPGNDRIGGSARDDTIFGQQGNDTIVGNDGIDYMDGGDGDDLFVGGGQKTIHGGSGQDVAQVLGGVGHEVGSGIEQSQVPTDISRRNGRTILKYSLDATYLTNYSLSQPTKREDGQYEVTLTSQDYIGGGDVVNWEGSVDISEVGDAGLFISYVFNGVPQPQLTTRLLLPRM